MSDRADDWRRLPGRGRYARPECERRFLVAEHPCPQAEGRLVEDRYLHGTRLRLRRVTVGGESVLKLTQKVRPVQDDPAEVLLTNLYLDEGEHARLRVLPAAVLVKTRRVVQEAGVRWAVDAFAGPLEGLVLAEAEVPSLTSPLALPRWVGREVTHDDRWSGGRLAALTGAQAAALVGGT